MFTIDDRTGNVVSTAALFGAAAAVLYFARGAFFILFLSLLLAYILEPAVALLERHSRLGRKGRSWAIAEVYIIGVLLLGTIGYEIGPRVALQLKKFNAALPEILHDLSTGQGTSLRARHGLTDAQQAQIHEWLIRHHDFVTRVFERGADSAAYIAESAAWLFVVPILAIFILRDGRQLSNLLIQILAAGGDQTKVRQIVDKVDLVLAKFIRAQLALATLSFGFYSVSMLLLRFPYAIALGVLGGTLELLPAIGWIASAATILTVGFLTHAHWIWMSLLLVLWRLVQDYVNSPRIMGNNLQLQPLTVLFALMVGGQIGGIVGLYLAVPIVAVLRIVWLGSFSTESQSTTISDQSLAGVHL